MREATGRVRQASSPISLQAGFDAIAAKYAKWEPPSLLKAQREAEEREALRHATAVGN